MSDEDDEPAPTDEEATTDAESEASADEEESPEEKEANQPAAEEAGAADSDLGSGDGESETAQEIAADDDSGGTNEDDASETDAGEEEQIEADREVAADAETDSTAPDEEQADIGPDADAADEGDETVEAESSDDGESDDTDATEGDGDTSEEGDEDAVEQPEDITPESLEERLEAIEERIGNAESEADLDEMEETLDETEAALERADLPEPDEDDEDAEDPRAELEAKIGELRDAVEEARGPYAEDVTSEIESARSTIEDTRWTDRGESEVGNAVESFLGKVGDLLDEEFTVKATDGGESETEDEDGEGNDADGDGSPFDDYLAALGEVIEAIENAAPDPDRDEGTIAELLRATESLEAGLEDAQEWDDLTVREKLGYEGFYDVIEPENRKDFPPEWNAIKIYEQRNEPEPILLAFDMLGSEYMEEHCIEAFKRMGRGAPEAFDVMHQRAQRRKKPPIEVLGKIGDDRALDTLQEYIEGEKDPGLQEVVLKAIGEIGSEASTQPVADRLIAESEEVRSRAANALGLIGDTRAIDPLGDVLRDDESDIVRASAARALCRIGTEDALEAAREYGGDRSYIVQSEAQWAEEALSNDNRTATAD